MTQPSRLARPALRRFALALLLVAAPMATLPAGASPPPAAAPKADPSAKRITGSEAYFPVFGLRATVSRGFELRGALMVDAGLDIPEAKTRKRAEALKPRIVSEMRDAVLNYASLSYVVNERPDADLLRQRMQKAIDGVLGKGAATVLLASVLVHDK